MLQAACSKDAHGSRDSGGGFHFAGRPPPHPSPSSFRLKSRKYLSMNEPPNVVSWLLTLFGLVLSVLGTVIILRWPTYATPIVQDKNTKKWVRLFAWTSDEGYSIGRW